MLAIVTGISVGALLIQLITGYALDHPTDSWWIVVSRKAEAKRFWSSLLFQGIATLLVILWIVFVVNRIPNL